MTRSTASGPPGRRLFARALLAVLRCYRVGISPLRPACCRYTPTCSAYAIEAIQLHRARHGCRLAVARVLRCHPFHVGGHDPVPLAVDHAGVDHSRHTRNSAPPRIAADTTAA